MEIEYTFAAGNDRKRCHAGSTSSQVPLVKKIKRESPIENKDGSDDVKSLPCPIPMDVDLVPIRGSWDLDVVLSQNANVPLWVAKNLVNLFKEDNTIPFIARYRRHLVNELQPEAIRNCHDTYENLRQVKTKACNMSICLEKEGKLTDVIKMEIDSAITMEELETVYAPFKADSKRTLAERARQSGLEESAIMALNHIPVDISSLVRPDVKGRTTYEEVQKGIQHIIADVVQRDLEINDKFMKMNVKQSAQLTSVRVKKQPAGMDLNKFEQHLMKFDTYHNFKRAVANVQPHQVMAINRGESLKVLTVKINLPVHIKQWYVTQCQIKFIGVKMEKENTNPDPVIRGLIGSAIEDAYSRLVEPKLCRKLRSELTNEAEKNSIKAFADNVKHLLLQPPVSGKVIMGIDPGHRFGCKMAVISISGDVIHTDVLRFNFNQPFEHPINMQNANTVMDLLANYQCSTIAIGNGTACRETEQFVTRIISHDKVSALKAGYAIVSESGVSIYSVTKEAEIEMPDLDPNLRSAVAIARRLLDPLSEYIKVEPKHIGVGMYQHDVNESKLQGSLKSVVEECVSFVGVDLNTSSATMLSNVAGLNPTLAKNIVEHRSTYGAFRNREQLLSVPGIGPKKYEQCAGFVRILPVTSSDYGKPRIEAKLKKSSKNISNDPDPLDRTTIHPESYSIARKLVEFLNLKVEFVGLDHFVSDFKKKMTSYTLENLSMNMQCELSALKLVVDSLRISMDYDIRAEFDQPIFRQSVRTIESLQQGIKVTGRVTNRCPGLGAFVDVGVGQDGLIHQSQLKGLFSTLKVGHKIEAMVTNLDFVRKRIGLRPLKIFG